MKALLMLLVILGQGVVFAGEQPVQNANVAGQFYPADPSELSALIDSYFAQAKPRAIDGPVIALIVPHAGYEYSGRVAAQAYKLIAGKDYTTVVVMGTSHRYPLSGASVFPAGKFITPLGELEVDAGFAQRLIGQYPDIRPVPQAFSGEHSLEVQLPFLQKALKDFKIVPLVLGECSPETCRRLSDLLAKAIAGRKDVLLVASSDLYHGYDRSECARIDNITVAALKDMDAPGLAQGLSRGTIQMCGGWGVVTAVMAAKALGHSRMFILEQTNSAEVTGSKKAGEWTVGYVSAAIDSERTEAGMLLTKAQHKKLLEIARNSIETYLKTGKKPDLKESDPGLAKEMGAFVTLHEKGELRGCIGNLAGSQPLYLTVRDMAVEAATGDPRFATVRPGELKEIELEISVLSPMERVDSADKIILGKHGVLVRRGFNSGVFLPQVATETGWSKEEFLSYLCSQKAGLAPDAWKDPRTELYVFTAEVFSEKGE